MGGVGGTKSKSDLLAKIDQSPKVISAVNYLNQEELLNLTNECNQLAGNKDHDYYKTKDGDILKHKLEKHLKESPLNTAHIVNEIMCQFVEPEIYIHQFLKITQSWPCLEEKMTDTEITECIISFEQDICEKQIKLMDGRQGGMRKELYYIVLPARLRLHNQDSTPVVDILTNILLGTQPGTCRFFFEIVDFSSIKNITNSTSF